MKSLYKFVSKVFFLSFIVLLNSEDIEYCKSIDFSYIWLLFWRLSEKDKNDILSKLLLNSELFFDKD